MGHANPFAGFIKQRRGHNRQRSTLASKQGQTGQKSILNTGVGQNISKRYPKG